MSVPALAPSRPAQRVARTPVIAPEFRTAGNPGAAVFQATLAGPIARDAIARVTGASIATVNRQVTALLAADLLRERADLTESGAIGRPRVPVQVNHDPYLTVGIHIGAVVTSITAADLRGRILGGVEIPTPQVRQDTSLTAIARSARGFIARWHRRRPLWAGVAIGGRVDAVAGTVDHPRLGWHAARVGEIVGAALELPVSVAAHVEAMAAAELLLAPNTPNTPDAGTGSSLFFYARETAGVAITLDGRVHTPSNGPGSIAHLPTGSDARCTCGRRGCLEATVGDRAVLARAAVDGVLPEGGSIGELYRAARDGSAAAHRILVERAEVLGHTVAMLRDLFNPDRVTIGGQAITEYRPGLPHVAEAFARASALPGKDVRVTGFGGRVQQYAAGVTALSVLYADPLSAVRRSGA